MLLFFRRFKAAPQEVDEPEQAVGRTQTFGTVEGKTVERGEAVGIVGQEGFQAGEGILCHGVGVEAEGVYAVQGHTPASAANLGYENGVEGRVGFHGYGVADTVDADFSEGSDGVEVEGVARRKEVFYPQPLISQYPDTLLKHTELGVIVMADKLRIVP